MPLSRLPAAGPGGGARDGILTVRLANPALAAELRRHDRDRYQTALFASADRRDALFALYAFNFEIARIREVVREPMIGLIRLQWWREALTEIYAGMAARRHAVAEPLAAAIRAYGLSQRHFEALLDARALDLEDTPPATLGALEAYAEGTSASLVLLALEILGAEAAEARAAGRAVGIAYALAGLLAAVPFHARQRRLLLPQDLVARHALDLERTLYGLKPAPALAAITREIAERAQHQLDAARALGRAVPRAALPALLPAVLAERRLRRLARAGYDVMDPRLSAEDGLQSWRLCWAALRGAY